MKRGWLAAPLYYVIDATIRSSLIAAGYISRPTVKAELIFHSNGLLRAKPRYILSLQTDFSGHVIVT